MKVVMEGWKQIMVDKWVDAWQTAMYKCQASKAAMPDTPETRSQCQLDAWPNNPAKKLKRARSAQIHEGTLKDFPNERLMMIVFTKWHRAMITTKTTPPRNKRKQKDTRTEDAQDGVVAPRRKYNVMPEDMVDKRRVADMLFYDDQADGESIIRTKGNLRAHRRQSLNLGSEVSKLLITNACPKCRSLCETRRGIVRHVQQYVDTGMCPQARGRTKDKDTILQQITESNMSDRYPHWGVFNTCPKCAIYLNTVAQAQTHLESHIDELRELARVQREMERAENYARPAVE
jgi:hypothetical protein